MSSCNRAICLYKNKFDPKSCPYTLRCKGCESLYCNMCRRPSHFPALCSDRKIFWENDLEGQRISVYQEEFDNLSKEISNLEQHNSYTAIEMIRNLEARMHIFVHLYANLQFNDSPFQSVVSKLDERFQSLREVFVHPELFERKEMISRLQGSKYARVDVFLALLKMRRSWVEKYERHVAISGGDVVYGASEVEAIAEMKTQEEWIVKYIEWFQIGMFYGNSASLV